MEVENPAGTAFSSTAHSNALTALLMVIPERLQARAETDSRITGLWFKTDIDFCHTKMQREEDSGASGPQLVGHTEISDR